MTVSTYNTVVYDLSFDPDRADVLPADTADAGIVRRNHGHVQIHGNLSRRWGASLASVASVGGDEGRTSQGARGAKLVRRWRAIELVYLQDDEVDYLAHNGVGEETTVTVRLHDGDGTDLWWDGAAWAVVADDDADWNTPAAIEANFATLDPNVAENVGVSWKLEGTEDATVSPVAFGALVAADLFFAWRSGSPAGRSDGWTDDLIHGVVLGFFEGIRPEVSDEFTTTADTDDIDYSRGIANKEGYVVAEVLEVFDVGADPKMRSPLAGTWDDGTKTWTFTSTVLEATTLVVRLAVEPDVGFMGDSDFFIEKMPAILIEAFDGEDDAVGSIPIYVRDVVAGTALRVQPPTRIRGTARCRVEAEDPTVAFAIVNAIKQQLEGGTKLLLSSGTGMPVALRGPFGASAVRGTPEVEGSSPFDLVITTSAWYGPAAMKYLLAPAGFTPSVDT